MVLRQGVALMMAGAAFGIACALVVSHLMAGFACYVPARRAIRIDPLSALRYE